MYNEEDIARPYARALAKAAHRMGILAQVRGDMEALGAQWDGAEELRTWATRAQSMPRAQHEAVARELWGGTMSEQVLILLEALSANGHLAAIPHVVRCFRRFADMTDGRIDVLFVFATEPSPEELASLTRRAQEAYGPQTQICTKIDPTLGAGLIIRAGTLQIDGSLRGRLRRLCTAFAH